MSRTSFVLALACVLTACHAAKDEPTQRDAGDPIETDASDSPEPPVPNDDAGNTHETDGGNPPEGDAEVSPGPDGGESGSDIRVSVPPDVICAGSCYDVRVGDTLQL